MKETKTYEELLEELEELSFQLREANDTIHAIRTGQIDALVVDINYFQFIILIKILFTYISCIGDSPERIGRSTGYIKTENVWIIIAFALTISI